MTELEGKILNIIQRQYDYKMYTAEELAKEIASAISEGEPDLPITPGEWEIRDDVDKYAIYGEHILAFAPLVARIDKNGSHAEADAKAIAALPKLLKAARWCVCVYKGGHTLKCIQALRDALGEAGVKCGGSDS